MSEHKWLTEKEVEQYKDAGMFDRFVADWLEMRKRIRNLVGDVRADARMRGLVNELPWYSLREAKEMLEATADD